MKHIITVCLSLLFIILSAPGVVAQLQNPLELYIEHALRSNEALKSKEISLQKAIISLNDAKSLFFPSVELLADYTTGEGGRAISIPVGDMLNPVYSTLNKLTGSNAFPHISNVRQDFFPTRFYDIKARVTMPILNTDIWYNVGINGFNKRIANADVNAYKRELIAEVKSAYFNYLSAVKGVAIWESALELAAEGKRINESLLKNGAGLPVHLLRSESEIEEIGYKILEAKNLAGRGAKYLNFLMNRALDEPVDTSYIPEPVKTLSDYNLSSSNREEIAMLRMALSIREEVHAMKKLFWIPKINAFVDLGMQESDFKLNPESRYYLFGLQLSVPLFEGFRNINAVENAALDVEHFRYELNQTERKIALAVSVAQDNLTAALKALQSAEKRLDSAQSYYNLSMKGYRSGSTSFIETVDARTQYTAARLSREIAYYGVLTAHAVLEREMGTAPLNYSNDKER